MGGSSLESKSKSSSFHKEDNRWKRNDLCFLDVHRSEQRRNAVVDDVRSLVRRVIVSDRSRGNERSNRT